MARLLMESGGERREIKVTGQLTVGRSQNAGVYLDDKTLSREHTCFFLQSGRLFVKDLESKNGTYLNGSLVKGDQPLKHGDRVKVGTATFTVSLEAGDAMPAVSAPLASPPPAHKSPTHHPAPHHGTPTQTAPAASVKPRPTLGGPHWFSVFIYRIILIVVIVLVAYVSKGFFVRLLSGINS